MTVCADVGVHWRRDIRRRLLCCSQIPSYPGIGREISSRRPISQEKIVLLLSVLEPYLTLFENSSDFFTIQKRALHRFDRFYDQSFTTRWACYLGQRRIGVSLGTH